MSYAKWFLGSVAALALASPSFAQTVLIGPNTNNGSFEYAGGVLNTAKIQMWDTTPDVDNWTEWPGISTAGTDSGVENTGFASDGTMVAFLQGGNAVYNLTDYVAAEGDSFVFSWDHVRREDRNHTVGLVYDDGGTITSIVDSEMDSTGILETINGAYVIPAGSPAIGKSIGLGVVSPGAYPEVDNFNLTVGGVPPVTGDVDGDGDVDLIDYGFIRDNFRLSPATKQQGDITGADIVDLSDFLLWRSNHPFPGAGSGQASLVQSVPEPAAWLLLTLGAAAIGVRKLRREKLRG
jgi:PEP-CTERM motif